MNGKIILCPKCDRRSWSSDYWGCSNCGYEVVKGEEFLLEENKDFSESRSRGDNPQMDLSFWMEEQENLTKEMVDKCLPKGKYNWKVNFPSVSWMGGETEYCENDLQEAELFKKRHAKELIEKGIRRVEMMPNGQWIIIPLYPYDTGSKPTKIKISKSLLTYEGSYGFDKMGYFPVIPHEAAHASPEVKRHPQFEPFGSQYDPSGKGNPGHDLIWKNKNREFYNKLTFLGYQKKIKERFKELRKIQGKDDNKHD